MTALALAFWKPIAAILAGLLAALGIYAKGRADAATKRDLRAAREFQQTTERAADAPHHTDPALARDRMRARDPDQR